MHLILTGATGTAGYPILQHLLASPSVTRISVLTRRSFNLPAGEQFDSKKANIIIHNEFNQYPDDLLNQLKGADGCIWAQGISQSEVPKDEYIRITYDFPMAAAKAFSILSNTGKFNFVYLSGEGADPTEHTFTLFGKIKGRCEKDLLALPESDPSYGALHVYNVRSGWMDPPEHHRSRPFLRKYVTDGTLGPIFRVLVPSAVTPTGELSKVMLDLAIGDGKPLQGPGIEANGRTVRSSAIRRIGAL